VAHIDFFFDEDKLSGMYSQKGVETIPTSPPGSSPVSVNTPAPVPSVPTIIKVKPPANEGNSFPCLSPSFLHRNAYM
jgi:hypothetical protein